MLNRNDILGARPRLAKVPVPEWTPEGADEDAFVYVRTFTAKERRSFKETYEGKDDAASRIFCQFVCDADGRSLFSPEDVEGIEGRDHDIVERVAMAVLVHSGLTKGAVEQAEKNSEATPRESSDTA